MEWPNEQSSLGQNFPFTLRKRKQGFIASVGFELKQRGPKGLVRGGSGTFQNLTTLPGVGLT